ncbi:hypothetical protein ACFQE1_22055, partial [Halobium palmae]
VVESLPPGATRTVQLGVSNLDGPTSVTVRAAYEVDGRTNRTVEQTVEVRANPGRIQLTGLDSADEGDYLRISGSASNVGLQPVDSVIVRVLPVEGVEPSPPNREYFVGTVPASDFVSFDVSAQVGANVSQVPLEVTYLSDGTRRSETVEVPVEPAVGSGAVGGSGGGS